VIGQNRKIIITGADGYLGSNLKNFLGSKGYEIHALTEGGSKREKFYQVDVTDKESVFKVIKSVNPEIIIHAAGISSLSQCEKENNLAWKINVEGTRNVIAAIRKVNSKIKLVFLSSDYAFSGEKGNYKESGVLKPKTFYGKTKVQSENDIKEGLENYIICRTANVYGRGGNFFNFIVENLDKNLKTEVFEDVFYTPTYIDYLLDCVYKLLEKDFKGVIHVAGKEKISRHQFALIVAEVLNKDKKLIKATKQPVGGLIAKDSSLNTSFSLKYINNFCPTMEKSLQYCFGNLIYPYFYFKDGRGQIL
jgi:dTDP-4-dehydrorhamnose reductase